MATKEYQREWKKRNPEKLKNYRENFKRRHPHYFMIYDRQNGRTNLNNKEYHKKYMKDYVKKSHVKIKKNIRRMTQYYHGKVPKGFERHHLDYNSPNNFILVPKSEHKLKYHLKN